MVNVQFEPILDCLSRLCAIQISVTNSPLFSFVLGIGLEYFDLDLYVVSEVICY